MWPTERHHSVVTGFRGEWWWAVFAPIVYYNIGQALDDYVLTPWIQGESTGLDAPAILFASIAGGADGSLSYVVEVVATDGRALRAALEAP